VFALCLHLFVFLYYYFFHFFIVFLLLMVNKVVYLPHDVDDVVALIFIKEPTLIILATVLGGVAVGYKLCVVVAWS